MKAVVGVAAVLSVEDSIVAGKRGELGGGESRKHENEQMLGLACSRPSLSHVLYLAGGQTTTNSYFLTSPRSNMPATSPFMSRARSTPTGRYFESPSGPQA